MANEKRMIDAYAFRRRIEAFVATARYKGTNNMPAGYESCNPTEYMRGYERGVMDAYTVAVEQPQVDAVEIPMSGIGDMSDGYHTFNELYHHRAMLFSVICHTMPERAWKSKLHHDGTMYDGMFIVGIDTPEGQATYHYDIEPYWDMFDVKELDRAPIFDGHTPDIAIHRIVMLGFSRAPHKEDKG